MNRNAASKVSWTKLLKSEDPKFGIRWPEGFPLIWNDKGKFNLDSYSDVQPLELEQRINSGGVKFMRNHKKINKTNKIYTCI